MEANGAVKCIRVMPPPQAMNNSETFTVSESIKRVLPYTGVCRIHGGYVVCNMFTLPTFIGAHTSTQMCLWLFCESSSCKLISAGLDPGSCSSPPPSPIICHHVGCCSLTCGLQMAVLCNAARTGATVPCAKQLSQFATRHCHSNESHFRKIAMSSEGMNT